MADTVNTVTHITTENIHIITITNESDSTGESGVVKIDASALESSDGKFGYSLKAIDVERITGNVAGFNYVTIEFNATTNDEIAVIGPGGDIDLDWREISGIINPLSTGNDRDIVLTTDGAADGDSYNLTLYTRFRYH